MDIKGLYEQAFGYLAKPVSTYQKISGLIKKGAAPPEISFLGSMMHMTTLIDKTLLPNEPLVSVTGSKQIQKTQVTGRKGTVKELISLDDYKITIKGILVDEENIEIYPTEMVDRLKTICELKRSVTVENTLFRIFDITQIAIESYDFGDMEGFPGVQPYTIHACSDDDPELMLIDNLGIL